MTEVKMIYYNLYESPYRVQLHGNIYVFSTRRNMGKFLDRVNKSVNENNLQMSNRYKFQTNISIIGEVRCYLSIEHIGCLIILPNYDTITQFEQILIEDGVLKCHINQELY